MTLEISDELLDRIDAALVRHLYGHAPRRIPVDKTDSDIVLFDLRATRAGDPCKFGLMFNAAKEGA